MKHRQGKILVVEDAIMVALHIRKSLESAGYEVMSCLKSGEEAVLYTAQHIPDLILMDIMLDGEMDGIEAATQISNKINIPIIYLTALTDKATIDRAKVTAPYGYIMKPFNEKELHTTIEMALHKSAIENDLRESQERFFSTVKSIGECLVTIQEDGVVSFLNEEAQKLSGIDLKNRKNENFSNIFSFFVVENDANKPIDLYAHLVNNAAIPEPILLLNNTSQEPFYVGDFNLSPIRNNKNLVVGHVLLFKDISHKIKEEKIKAELRMNNIAALIEGQEMERIRVARELHDGLGQMLTAIKLQLEQIEARDAQLDTKKILNEIIENAIVETKRISDNLMPLQLNELELEDCTESLCRSFNQVAGTSVICQSTIHSLVVDQKIKVNIYRVIQEALSNAMKHAQASHINVQLNNNDETLFLTIEDDGNGFDVGAILKSTKKEGHGMSNMMDRVSILGGNITFDSSPQFGTMISVEAPIKKTKTHD